MQVEETAAVVLTDATFRDEILEYPGVALVDVGADWCGPCRAIAPVIERLAGAWRGKVKVGTVDADANPGLVVRFGIRSIPALLLFKGGKQVDSIIGADHRLEQILTEKVRALGAGV